LPKLAVNSLSLFDSLAKDEDSAVGWVELSLLIRYYQSAQKAKPNKDCENIPRSCWVSLRQPKLRDSTFLARNL
jgi:hypothetical protein